MTAKKMIRSIVSVLAGVLLYDGQIRGQSYPDVDWPTNLTATYGQTLSNITLPGNSGSTAGTFSWTSGGTTPVGIAGTQSHNVTFTPHDVYTYYPVSQNVNITVAKATLTVIADNKSKTYGEVNPVLTVTFSGFVNGENQSVITTHPSITTTATTNSPVSGSPYTITLSGGSAPNYIFSNVSGTLTVNPAPLIVKADDKSKIYGEANPVFTISYLGFISGDNAGNSNITPPTITNTGGDTPSAGNHSITLSGGSAPNYTLVLLPGTLLVMKANPAVNWPFGLTANNGQRLSDIALPGNGTSTPSGTFAWTNPSNLVGATGTNQHSMTFTPSDATNYNSSTSLVSVSVGKNNPVVNWPTDLTATYNQTLSNITLPSNGSGTPGVFSWTASGTTLVGNAGVRTHNLTFTPTDGDNFGIVTQNVTITVNKAPAPAITWPVAAEATYTLNMPLSSISFSGGSTALGTFGWTSPATRLTAGTANQTMTLTFNQTTRDNYDVSATMTGNVSVTINKASPQLSWISLLPEKTYGDTEFSIDSYVSSVSTEQTVKFQKVSGGAVEVNEYGIVTIVHAGFATIEAFIEESDNYLAQITYSTRTITVAKAPLTIKPDDLKLQECRSVPPFTLSYSGFVYDDNELVLNFENLQFTTTIIGDNTCIKGEYEIEVWGITSVNYLINREKGQLLITDRPVLTPKVLPVSREYGDDNPPFEIVYTGFEDDDNMENYTISVPPTVTCFASRTTLPREELPYTVRVSGGWDDKYDILQVEDRALTIVKATLTVTADNKWRIEGEENRPFTFTFSGFKNDDDPSIFEEDELPIATTDATSTSLQGKYEITLSLQEENQCYNFKLVNGTLTILPTTTIMQYGSDPFVVLKSEEKITMEQLIFPPNDFLDLEINENGEVIANILNCGNTYISYTVPEPSVTVYITVTKKPLTIKAKSYQREQGKQNPDFELEYSEFAYDEGPSILLNPLPLAVCEVPPSAAPGEYKITVEYERSSDNKNYSIDLIPGTLEVVTGKKLPTAFFPYIGRLTDVWPWADSNYSVEIFNRLGVLLYKGNNGWDGKYKGNYVQPGVYFYHAISPEGVASRGTVEVVRTK